MSQRNGRAPSVQPSVEEEAEAAVLGAMLADPAVAVRLAATLRPEHFGRNGDAAIFRAATHLAVTCGAIDVVLLRDELTRTGEIGAAGGVDRLVYLLSAVPSAANADHYAGIVRDAAARRRTISACRQAAALASDPSSRPEDALGVLLDATREGDDSGIVPIAECIPAAVEGLDGGIAPPVPTGLEPFDAHFGGLPPEGLVVLAARPSMGKTSLALQIAAATAARGPVLIWSLEMNRRSLVTILIGQAAGVDTRKLRAGRVAAPLSPAEDRAVAAAASRLHGLPIGVVDAATATPESIYAIARNEHARRPLAMIVVDYLQLLDASSVAGKGVTREREVAHCSRMLKQISRACQCPVLALSQLSRQGASRKDPRPILSDLRDSGAIEQDADVVMFLHRPEMLTSDPVEKAAVAGEAQVIVAKFREGVTGSFESRFDAATQTFRGVVAPPPVPSEYAAAGADHWESL